MLEPPGNQAEGLVFDVVEIPNNSVQHSSWEEPLGSQLSHSQLKKYNETQQKTLQVLSYWSEKCDLKYNELSKPKYCFF